MSLLAWVILYMLQSLFFKWVLSWGGASWLVGLKAVLSFGWFTWDWNAEQLRLYALILWFFASIWFVIGIFNPELRI